MKKIIFSFVFIVGTSFMLHAQYLPSSTTRITTSLTHDGNLRIGTSTSSADRTRCVINFGDGDYVKIGEYEDDDYLSFKARGLQFNSNAFITYGSSLVLGPKLEEGHFRIKIIHNGTHGYLDYKDNLYFRADKSWICPLALYGNGTVGIGFSPSYTEGNYKNQGYKLAVNGGIICEEIKVIFDVPDADYVFDTDYNLKSLSEVEAFIIENKHLPDIPSAEDFKANGYKVGDMDKMLLQKVEELILYLIEQNKRIEMLEQENTALKESILSNK